MFRRAVFAFLFFGLFLGATAEADDVSIKAQGHGIYEIKVVNDADFHEGLRTFLANYGECVVTAVGPRAILVWHAEWQIVEVVEVDASCYGSVIVSIGGENDASTWETHTLPTVPTYALTIRNSADGEFREFYADLHVMEALHAQSGKAGAFSDLVGMRWNAHRGCDDALAWVRPHCSDGADVGWPAGVAVPLPGR